MVKYARLFRLKSTTIYLFPFVLALSVGLEQVRYGEARPVPYSWVSVLFAFLAYFCGSFFSSTLNCYADAPADRLHDGLYKDQDLGKQPFATGEMSKAETVLTFGVTGGGCIVFSLLVNPRFSLFMLGAVFLLGVLYSHPWFRFKEKPVLDIVTNSAGAVLILCAGMSVVSKDIPPALVMIFGSILGATMYIPSVANDVPFDEAVGYRTSGVVFGQKNLIHAMVPLTALLLPLGAWVALSDNINWQYRLFDGMAAIAALAATVAVMFTYHPPHIELSPLFMIVPLGSLLILYFVLVIYRLSV